MKTGKLFVLATCLIFARFILLAATISTEFTYQGRLNTGTNPANGYFDFRAGIFDALTGGNTIGERLDLVAVPVSNGHFILSLDFGDDAFDGTPRWLQIAVKTNAAGSLVTLTPRQALTATPHASFALGAATAAQATTVANNAITTAKLADGAVTSSKIAAGAVKPANIDDGGSAGYDAMQESARFLSPGSALPFTALSLVSSNGGAAPALSFTLDGSTLGTVMSFAGREALSAPYQFVVVVSLPGASLNTDAQLGRQGQLTFARNGRSTRFAGVVTGCALASNAGTNAHYSFRLESPLSYLALSTDYRIFQQQTVPDLVSDLYATATTNSLNRLLTGNYSVRVATIQYAESGLNFFNRLLEDEGIFYFFQPGAGLPTLTLGDDLSAYQAAANSPFSYHGNGATNLPVGAEYLRTFQKSTRDSTLTAKVSSYDFAKPAVNLEGSGLAALGGRGEQYEFGTTRTTKNDNDLIAQRRANRFDIERATMFGTGNAPDLRPGHVFTLDDQSGSGVGGDYVVTEVRHAAYRRLTNGVASLYYGNEFEVVPSSLTFVPARQTPKPVARACTAVVTGQAGEEIWTDSYGRVKVHFPWDRHGSQDQNSSGWIRVASQLAGQGWGTYFLPRMGQEVLVDFLNGDPDQPVIVGSLYNAEQMRPYPLPDEKTKSGIKTHSSKGGAVENANEIRFEDKKGSEQLFIHAEKNLDREVENDMTSWVGHDATSTVDHDLTASVKHDLTLSVSNNLKVVASQGIGINTANNPAVALNVGGTIAATLFQGSGASLNNLPATSLTGTINDARLSANVGLVAGNQTFTGAKTFNNAANSFTGNGSGLTSVNADLLDGQHGAFYQNAANLNAGTLPDARLSANVPRLDGSQSFSGNNTFLGRVSVGGAMGLDTLNISGTARLNNYDLLLRGDSDMNHGLGWYGSGKLFAGLNLDGPVLYGCDGGGLGSACSSQKLALRWRSDGNVAIDPNSLNSGALLPGLTFGNGSGEGISSKRTAGGNGFGLDLYTSNQVRVAISQAGNVGIGKTNPSVTLDVVGPIRVTGAIRSGSETGASPPAYPSGSDGLVIRRVRSTASTAGSIVARTDKLTLERDGSIAGLRLSYPASPGYQIINCTGINTNGTQVVYRKALGNPASAGTVTVFSDAQRIVHYDISFGDTYSSTPGHHSQVVLDRYEDAAVNDNYLVGTITSTYNQ